MQKERVFSKDGGYELCLSSNALMHREGTELGIAVLRETFANHVSDYATDDIIHVLDLACGSSPVALASMLAEFPDRRFNYTGIDINADQIQGLQDHFTFADNVLSVTAITGDAWDLSKHDLREQYDVIFKGFNLHHGTPEEILFLAQQLQQRVSPRGVFFNTDEYRPTEHHYTRRPDCNLQDAQESYRLVDQQRLQTIHLQQTIIENEFTEVPAWKQQMIQGLQTVMLDSIALSSAAALTHSAVPVPTVEKQHAIVNTLLDHVTKRDFPISIDEAEHIFQQVGFQVSTQCYAEHYPEHPLAQYFALLVCHHAN